MKSLLSTLALLLSNIVLIYACPSTGDIPANYNVYRVCDDIKTPYFCPPNYKQRNLQTWQQETDLHIPLDHIEEVVYRYSSSMYEACMKKPQMAQKNKFVQYLATGLGSAYPKKLLSLAKRVEEARSSKNDPWYYPSSHEDSSTTLDLLLCEANRLEEDFITDNGDDSFYVKRLQLQRIRLLFSLGRYADCIELWENKVQHWDTNELMRTMIKDYIAGAYQHLGEETIAKQYHLEQGNYQTLAEWSSSRTGNYAAFVREMYDFNPDCADIVASVMQYDLCDYYRQSSDVLSDYYEVMQYILRTHRSRDMSIWYYTAAYLEDNMGYS